MDQSVLFETDVDKTTEVGDVGHDSRQNHAFLQIFYGMNVRAEAEFLNLVAWVASGLVQFLQDIPEGG